MTKRDRSLADIAGDLVVSRFGLWWLYYGEDVRFVVGMVLLLIVIIGGSLFLFGCQISRTIEIRDAEQVTINQSGGGDTQDRGRQSTDVAREAEVGLNGLGL